MASGSNPGVGEAGVGLETRRVHDWVTEGMELRFAFLVNIRRDRYIVDAKNKKKFHGGLNYPLPMDYEADNDVHLVDDEVGEEEDLATVEWDRENPQMEEGSVFASMSECRNALVMYCIKAERTFEVDKSDQVKVNPFNHTCEESTLRKETISRAKSIWVAEEVKRWVTENHQVGAKELQKNIKGKFKIELPYMRVFNGKQQAMDSIYGNAQESFELLYSFKAEVERTSLGPAGNIHQYVHDYYSITRFKATYAHALPALEGKQQWDKVDTGFKLCAPILKRTGRPRKSRIRPCSEGGGLGARRRKCTRCGGSGHFAKYCDNTVDPAFGESFDENVDTNEDHNEDQNVNPNEEENVDPNDDPNEAPNDDPNDDPNEDDPNGAGQPSMVASLASSVVVSKNKVKVPITKRRREEAMSTRSKVDARSTRITRSKVDATSTRITRSKVEARSTRIKTKSRRFVEL
ncbi:hypothetical protein ACQ4PT_047699 [Festuca glaucescens]